MRVINKVICVFSIYILWIGKMEKLIRLIKMCNDKMGWGIWVFFLNGKVRYKSKIREVILFL